MQNATIITHRNKTDWFCLGLVFAGATPPYGKEIGLWVRRAWLASASGNTVVMLLPARTDTKWFHDYIYKKSRVETRFVRGRLKFGDSKNSAPFPSMVCIFRKGGEG